MYNQSGPADSRKVLSGKDAVLFNGEGVMLATIENFQVQVNVSNSDYQPLGDAQAHATMTGYKVSLNFSQIVIEDDALITDMFEMMHSGQQPNWVFQGVTAASFPTATLTSRAHPWAILLSAHGIWWSTTRPSSRSS